MHASEASIGMDYLLILLTYLQWVKMLLTPKP